jgi:hypothetical protein
MRRSSNSSPACRWSRCSAARAFPGVDHSVRDYLRIETAITSSSSLANITSILPVGLWLMSEGTLDAETFLLFVIVGAGYS